MKLYLLRHGESAEGADDDARSLTTHGREALARLAEFIQPDMLANAQVLHSNKQRAKESALVFKGKVSPNCVYQERSELRPNADIEIILAEIEASHQDMFLVSHLPFLGKLVAQLVTNNQYQSVVNFMPGTLVCLEKIYYDQWLINWMLTSSLF